MSRTSTLFLGNSFIYFNDLPNVIQDMFKASSISTFEHDQVTPGGQSLIGHAKDENVKNAFDKRSTTFVILQDNSQVPGGYDKDMLKETHGVLESYFIPRIRKNNSVPILFETWVRHPRLVSFFEILNSRVALEHRDIFKAACTRNQRRRITRTKSCKPRLQMDTLNMQGY